MFGRQQYRKATAATAQPAQLITMLYDGTVRFLDEAERALGAGDRPRATGAIGRALDVIAYLQAILRPDLAPGVGAALDRTYLGWTTVLFKASAAGDAVTVASVRRQVAGLRDAWSTAAGQAPPDGRDAGGTR